MDKLREKSDKELTQIEKELTKIYRDADKQIREKWDKYMERAAKRTERLEKALADAKAKNDADEIKKAADALKNKQNAILHRDEKFREMAQQTAERLSEVNSIAQAYVNDQMPRIYALNYNGTLQEISAETQKVGIGKFSFDLVDERTLRILVKDDMSLFPQKVIDKAKDMAWNLKAINSQVTQGILQGESIPHIAKRLENVSTMDKNAAIRSARTMCTAAENNGRLAGMKEADDDGIVYEKQWMSTHDGRTRESHQQLDGETVPLDEEFSNGLMYPADPDGDDAEIYNCRCSMVRQLIGFRRSDGRISKVDGLEDYKPTYFDDAKATKASTPTQSDWRMSKAEFTPAKTIADAEAFAKNNFVRGGFNLTGKSVSFKGLDVDVANEINNTLNDIYAKFNIDKLSSLEAYGKRDKRAYSQNADAPFFTTNMGNIGINSTIIPSMSKAEKYAEKGRESFDYVIKNMEYLTGAQLNIAKSYEKAGRSLVDDSVTGMVAHEVGHHISYMTEINKALSNVRNNDEWKSYAENLSGYANHSFGEYVAESFSAYYKGETEKLQKDMIAVFEGLRKNG